MQSRQLGIFALGIVAFAAVIGGVLAYQRPATPPRSDVQVDAPFAHVEDGANGTHVQAPGVDIHVPKKPVD